MPHATARFCRQRATSAEQRRAAADREIAKIPHATDPLRLETEIPEAAGHCGVRRRRYPHARPRAQRNSYVPARPNASETEILDHRTTACCGRRATHPLGAQWRETQPPGAGIALPKRMPATGPQQRDSPYTL